MQLAYSSLACPQWTIEEAVAAAVRYGYEAIEWRLADGELISPQTPSAVLKRLHDVPVAHGLTIACLDTSCRVVQESWQARTAVLEEAQRMADIAANMGAPYLRVFGGAPPPGTIRADAMAAAAEMLQALGEYCQERGIRVVLETHDAWSQSTDVRTLLDMVTSAGVGVLWDIFHTVRSGEEPAYSVTQLGSTIAFVHVKDGRPRANRSGEWELCLLTEGRVPLLQACSTLKAIGYDGYLSFEWEKKWHPEIAEPQIALAQAAPLLRQLWREAVPYVRLEK